jgi:predicted N-formylglutamate amidohydrolase
LGESNVLLHDDEPPPYTVLSVPAAHPALLVCDHATNRVPARLDGLGVSPADLKTHFAVDVGAAAVSELISQRLRLPAVLTGYSRLVVDCNRRLDDATAFPDQIDGVIVPGNQGLTQSQREARANSLYWPYHHAVREQLSALESLGAAPALIAIHSFTPELGGQQRPWHFGVLWDKDPRIPRSLLVSLGAVAGVQVGDNEPYSGKHPHDFTIDHHAEAEGLPHVSIEIRQDLIETDEGVQHWGGILADTLEQVLADPDLYTHWTR